MSLAYLEGKDGRLQVAYEAMDKISIFKHEYWWITYCPCHNLTMRSMTHPAAVFKSTDHLKHWNHSNED